MLNKIVSDSHDFFTFFFSIFLRHYVTYVPAGFGKVLLKALILGCHGRIQRGDRGSGPPPPLKNHKNLGFLGNTGPDLLKNHKATKPAFNVGPLSARQRNAIYMAFRWRADGGPPIVVF